MKGHFERIVDAKFTAQMESDLDKIEAGKADWVDVLGKFYTGFDKMLTKAEKDMEGKRVKIPDEPTDIAVSYTHLKYPFVYATIYPYHIKFAGDKMNAEIDISDVVRNVSG